MEKENNIKRVFSIPEESGVLFELKQNSKDLQEVLRFKLIKKTQISHNSFIFSFQFPKGGEDKTLGIQIGEHIAMDIDLISEDFPDGEPVCRKYTPISWIEQKGTVDILIKIYYKTEKFPEGGKMTTYLDALEIGKEIDVRGPFGKFKYLGDGNGQFLTKYNPLTYEKKYYSKIGLLGAGTGITPLFQVLNSAYLNGETKVEFTLFYGNSTEKDILLRKELEEFVQKKNFPFKLILMINSKEDGWTGEVGHFNEENIKKYMPEPSDNTLILHCGPRNLCREVYVKVCKQLGHKPENIYEF